MKLLTIVGARPQFIKAAAVSRVISTQPEMREVIVHTGQHFDVNMSDVFFNEMQIPRPDYHLDIHSLSHGAMTGRMLEAIEKVLLQEQPDCVLVYGDTNSTLAGALAAKKMQIPVAHVEAGLRSFNQAMPEEINRILTDRISDFLFCPTEAAVKNLENEGFNSFDSHVFLSGDVMEDAAIYYARLAQNKSTILEDLGLLHKEGYFLCTIHRAENTNAPDRLKAIVAGLNELATTYEIILPLHPRTKIALDRYGINIAATIIEPVGYFDMLNLIRHANLIITDSGGLQKEAYFFNKYCITLRDETEWLELVNAGYNVLVGANKEQLLHMVEKFSERVFSKKDEFYGGGKAADLIVSYLLERL